MTSVLALDLDVTKAGVALPSGRTITPRPPTDMTRRYPLEALAALAGMKKSALQQHLKVSGREWGRYWSEGLAPLVADRCAVRCGYHPAEVWPSWFDDASEDVGRVCADCGDRFIPTRVDHRFCSTKCRKRTYQRHYRTRPYAREANRVSRRAYYAANTEYEKARERHKHRREVTL